MISRQARFDEIDGLIIKCRDVHDHVKLRFSLNSCSKMKKAQN